MFFVTIFEPRHEKTNKVSVRPAKTQISLGIRPVWSESSLSAWRNLWSLATHWAHSEDSDQTGRMPRLISIFAGRTVTLLVLSFAAHLMDQDFKHNKSVERFAKQETVSSYDCCLIFQGVRMMYCCGYIKQLHALHLRCGDFNYPYGDFWKWGANLRIFTKGMRILRKFWFWCQN